MPEPGEPRPPDSAPLEYASNHPIWQAGTMTRTTDIFRDPAAPAARLTYKAAIAVAWRITLGVGLGLLAIVLWFGGGPALAIITPIALLVLIPVTAGAMRLVRRRRALIVLTYIEQAVRLNLPLPRMLDAAQRSETGRTGRRLASLAALLDGGAPIGGAMAVSMPETPKRTLSLISSGERLGQLPATLARIVDEERADLDADPQRESFARWYPLLMTLGMGSLVMTFIIFVIPKFEDIFRDFGLRLPDQTVTLLGIARFIANSEVLAVLVLLVLALIALYMIGGAFRAIFDAGDRDAALAAARGPGSWDWLDTALWYVPVVHGVSRDRGLADASRTIADALRTGRPLPRAIEEATVVRMNAVLRRRLAKWGARATNGVPPDQAAREARLPDLFAGMIGPAAGQGPGAVAAFEFLADYYGTRFSRSRELLRAAAVPLLVLIFGALVLFIVSALLMPLITMIDHLNEVILRTGSS